MSRITSAQPSSRTRCFCQGIHAVGSVAAIGVPGAEEFAYLLANPDGAQAAHDTIAKIRPGQQVVVGGGATGVEAAAEIAEQHPDAQVALLCGDNLLRGHAGARTGEHLQDARAARSTGP